jgi:hypothetical protein
MRYLLILLLLCVPAWGANHYILSTATGTDATWTESTSTLTKTGFFANVTVGQYVQVISGTNMVPRFWVVSSRTDNTAVISGSAGTADTTAYIATGTSWTDAFTNLPVYNFTSYLIRGDTYYVGDGEYGSTYGMNFADTESGTTLITIKKAIAADHGTETGWDAGYGDGQAVWTQVEGTSTYAPWGIVNDYYVFDGQTGGGPSSWKSGHGFKIVMLDTSASPYKGRNGICFGTTGAVYTNQGNHITISHVEIQGPGANFHDMPGHRAFQSSWTSVGAIGDYVGPDSITIDHCYVHDLSGVALYMVQGSNITWEYNAIVDQTSRSGAEFHAEPVAFHGSRENMIFRYSLFENCGGTAGIAAKRNYNVLDTGTTAIYGNVFYSTAAWIADTDEHRGFGEGIVSICVNSTDDAFADNPMTACYVYNNTMINLVANGSSGVHLPHVETCVVANNIWMNCTLLVPESSPNYTNVGFYYHDHTFTVDYNLIINTTSSSLAFPKIATNYISADEHNLWGETTDPFTDCTTLDFSLTAQSSLQGTTGPYTTDWVGTTRGNDGRWDVGALEFVSPPSGTNIMAQQILNLEQ